MSSDVLSIRATEIASLRDKNRRLRRRIAEMESVIRDNDDTVTMMHRLSALLIARESGWRAQAELLLRRGLKAADADIYSLSSAADPLSAKIAKLPAGGRADDSPLRQTAAAMTKGALYYHLPLKSGRRPAGLLTLTLRQKGDLRDGDDEFCRRLAMLLSAAIVADRPRRARAKK